MPYLNSYNKTIAQQLQNVYQNKIAHDNAMTDNARPHDILGQVESVALHNDNITGGNGTAAATLQDLGYEVMNGTTGTDVKVKRKYTRKKTLKPDTPAVEVVNEIEGKGISAGGISAGGVSAGDLSAAGVSAGAKKTRKKKEPPTPPPEPTTEPKLEAAGVSAGSKKPRKKKEVPASEVIEAAAPKPTEPIEGSGKKGRSERAEIVKKIMQEKGLKLIEASRYVKEHNLYKKSVKGGLLTLMSVDDVKPVGDIEPPHTGGVQNVTYSGAGKRVKKVAAKK